MPDGKNPELDHLIYDGCGGAVRGENDEQLGSVRPTQPEGLVIGREYRNGHGDRVNIAGPTKDNKAWVYSIQGNWYVQATGMFLWYQKDGSYITRGEAGEGRNIPLS